MSAQKMRFTPEDRDFFNSLVLFSSFGYRLKKVAGLKKQKS